MVNEYEKPVLCVFTTIGFLLLVVYVLPPGISPFLEAYIRLYSYSNGRVLINIFYSWIRVSTSVHISNSDYSFLYSFSFLLSHVTDCSKLCFSTMLRVREKLSIYKHLSQFLLCLCLYSSSGYWFLSTIIVFRLRL